MQTSGGWEEKARGRREGDPPPQAGGTWLPVGSLLPDTLGASRSPDFGCQEPGPLLCAWLGPHQMPPGTMTLTN